MSTELANYLERLEDLRAQVSALVTDLPAEALNWRPIEGSQEHATNSLAVLAAHTAGAEHFWIAEIVGGRPATSDREAEFATRASSSAEIVRLLEATALETREILQSLTDADLEGTRPQTASIWLSWLRLFAVLGL